MHFELSFDMLPNRVTQSRRQDHIYDTGNRFRKFLLIPYKSARPSNRIILVLEFGQIVSSTKKEFVTWKWWPSFINSVQANANQICHLKMEFIMWKLCKEKDKNWILTFLLQPPEILINLPCLLSQVQLPHMLFFLPPYLLTSVYFFFSLYYIYYSFSCCHLQTDTLPNLNWNPNICCSSIHDQYKHCDEPILPFLRRYIQY